MNGHESFLIKQRVFCEVGSCFRYASRVIKIEGRETVFCHHHPYGDPEPIDLTESMETNTILSGGEKIQVSPRGSAPSQNFSVHSPKPEGTKPSVVLAKRTEVGGETLFSPEADKLFEHRPYCCPNCSEIDARQSMEQKL